MLSHPEEAEDDAKDRKWQGIHSQTGNEREDEADDSEYECCDSYKSMFLQQNEVRSPNKRFLGMYQNPILRANSPKAWVYGSWGPRR